MKRHKIRIFILLLAILACGLIITGVPSNRETILLAIGDYLNASDTPLLHGDVIHVLGGDLPRVDYGIELYQQGYAPYLLFTGGYSPPIKRNYAEVASQYATKKGIPETAIVTHHSTADSTYAEAIELAEVIARHPELDSVIVVSSPYHLRRARWSFRHVIKDKIQLQFAALPYEQDQAFTRRWWTDPPSRHMLRREYLVLAYYIWHYQISKAITLQ